MNRARLALLASAVLGTLALAAAAIAAPTGDGASQSGGAQALPVVPSAGGGSEPLLDAPPQVTAPVPESAPPVQLAPAAPEAPGDILFPLQGQDVTEPAPTGGLPEDDVGSSEGGFGFLSAAGLEIIRAVAALFR
ncbi:MAG: hypothetical protein JW895_03215 [Thermoleophilaceae bacterium]|nr:hypothetical protein [Thermoleophilaceae bacterium]